MPAYVLQGDDAPTGIDAPTPEMVVKDLERQRSENDFLPKTASESIIATPTTTETTLKSVSTNIFLPWKDLKQDHLRTLPTFSSNQARRDFLEDVLQLRRRYPDEGSEEQVKGNDKRREIFLDLTMQILAFCKRSRMSSVKTSTLFSIIRTTHMASCELPGPPPSFNFGFTLFEDLLLKHSIERPPFSVAVFAFHEVKVITAFIVGSYFRHLKMYQYVFGTTNELDLQPTQSLASMVDPAKLQPLDSATLYTDKVPEDQAQAAGAEGSEESTSLDARAGDEGKATSDNEEEVAARAGADLPSAAVPQIFDNERAQAQFAETLTGELAKLQVDMQARLLEQQQGFMARLSNLESAAGVGGSIPKSAEESSGGKKKKKKKKSSAD